MRLRRGDMSSNIASSKSHERSGCGSGKLWSEGCQINRETIKQDLNLIEKVSRCDFQLVYLQPEFCRGNNRSFLCMSKTGNEFTKRLRYIVVDEAHLCHAWRSFRVQYANKRLYVFA